VFNQVEEIADEITKIKHRYSLERVLVVDYTNKKEG